MSVILGIILGFVGGAVIVGGLIVIGGIEWIKSFSRIDG